MQILLCHMIWKELKGFNDKNYYYVHLYILKDFIVKRVTSEKQKCDKLSLCVLRKCQLAEV